MILERNSFFNHQKFPEIQQKNGDELWLQGRKKGDGSTVFAPHQDSTLQDASYQISL